MNIHHKVVENSTICHKIRTEQLFFKRPKGAMVVAGGALPHAALPNALPSPSATFWTTTMATKPPPATFEPPNSPCELQICCYNSLYAYMSFGTRTSYTGEGSWRPLVIFDRGPPGPADQISVECWADTLYYYQIVSQPSLTSYM